MRALGAILLVGLVAGCDPIAVTALTVAPPGKTATLDDEHLWLDLSRGTAMAFECTARDDGYQGPCRNARAKIANEDIAIVYASYLDSLAPTLDDGDAGPRRRTAFVVVGLQEGETELEVVTSDGDVALSVSILP